MFGSDLRLPETVYIVGSGPNWDGSGIPDCGYVIALNRAIEIPGLKTDLWMSWAMAYCDKDWWKARMALQDGPPRLFGEWMVDEFGQECEYVFTYSTFHEMLHEHKFAPGVLLTGGTIAGAALQLCYWWKVKKVIFAGVDMFGQGYFDGQIRRKKCKENAWGDRKNLDLMIGLCRKAGMVVSSLSSTALDIPVSVYA